MSILCIFHISYMSISQFLEFFPVSDMQYLESNIGGNITLLAFFVSHSFAMACNGVDCSFVHYVLLSYLTQRCVIYCLRLYFSRFVYLEQMV